MTTRHKAGFFILGIVVIIIIIFNCGGFMVKRGRGRPPKENYSTVVVRLNTDLVDLMREIAKLSGKTIGETYNDFLLSALPALQYTKKLYEDLANLPESSRSSFVDSLNDHVANLQNAVEAARQIDIFNNQQA